MQRRLNTVNTEVTLVIKWDVAYIENPIRQFSRTKHMAIAIFMQLKVLQVLLRICPGIHHPNPSMDVDSKAFIFLISNEMNFSRLLFEMILSLRV